MENSKIVQKLSQLGTLLSELLNGDHKDVDLQSEFHRIMKKTSLQNPWFTTDNIRHVLENMADDLKTITLTELLYKIVYHREPKRIAVILAGNKPLYGCPELFCVLLSGHVFVGKQVAEDNELLEFISYQIKVLIPEFSDQIVFEKSKLENFDAIIANDYKIKPDYFQKYFNSYPHLMHERKFSVAVLTGKENDITIKNLGKDIFTYFQRTIYNVTNLLVPEEFDFERFLENLNEHRELLNFHRYADQYEYNKSVYLINKIQHLDNGFLLLREHSEHHTPVGCLHYITCKNQDTVTEYLHNWKQHLESVVTESEGIQNIQNRVSPGMAAKKGLFQRSRISNTIDFLNNL